MPYLAPIETDELHLPSDPRWIVKMKRKGVYGDWLAGQSATLKVTQGSNGSAGQVSPELVIGAYMRTLIVRLVVEWNLTDENDQPLAIAAEAMEQLQTEDGEFLALEAQKRVMGRSSAEQIPFLKASGQHLKASRSITPKR